MVDGLERNGSGARATQRASGGARWKQAKFATGVLLPGPPGDWLEPARTR